LSLTWRAIPEKKHTQADSAPAGLASRIPRRNDSGDRGEALPV